MIKDEGKKLTEKNTTSEQQKDLDLMMEATEKYKGLFLRLAKT